MDEADDSLDDWSDLMTSPTGLLSGFISEPCFSNSVSDALSGGVFMSNPEVNLGEDEIRVGSMLVVDNAMANSGSSISDFDFNDTSPLATSGSDSGSLCLTIPSGISPNELFGSPVMLPNSQLSPTTGTLASTPFDHDSPMLRSEYVTADMEQDGDPHSLHCYAPTQNQSFSPEDDCQSLVAVQQPLVDFEFLAQQDNPRSKRMQVESSKIAFDVAMKAEAAGFQHSRHPYGAADSEMIERTETTRVADAGRGGQSVEGVQKGVYPSELAAKTSEDGYSWRKYGQKQVKGSEFPRSYFKCTFTSCLVKKKVERSHDGDVTEIIYKGAHNHPKPQPSNRRSTFGSAAPCGESTDIGEGSGSYVKADPVWREMQQHGYKDTKVGSEWRSEGLDIASSASVITEVNSDPHSGNQNPVSVLDSALTPEFSSTLASHDEEEEDATIQGSLSVGEDDDVENESKRRKKESSLIETALGSRAHREPRVIVQIESEVDIIDDGYRWRKYGQKVVKGNPNPRSYYKCTTTGCTVRKHVERASHNLKYVLTTYEGKHNHVVPAARNSGNGNLPASSSSQSTLILPRNSHLPKSEHQDFIPPYDRKMEYESDFFRSNYLGSLSSASSFYHLKFPNVSGSGLYGGFGLNPNYSSSTPSIPSVRDLSIPLPLNFSLPSSFAMGGYSNQGRPLNPVPPFYMGQQLKESDVKLLRPKQEL